MKQHGKQLIDLPIAYLITTATNYSYSHVFSVAVNMNTFSSTESAKLNLLV